MSDVELRRDLSIANSVDAILGSLSLWLDERLVNWFAISQPLHSWTWNTSDFDVGLDVLVVVNDLVFWLEQECRLFNVNFEAGGGDGLAKIVGCGERVRAVLFDGALLDDETVDTRKNLYNEQFI